MGTGGVSGLKASPEFLTHLGGGLVYNQNKATSTVASCNSEFTGGNMLRILVAALVVAVAFAIAPGAFASNSKKLDPCPQPFATGYTCQFQPATVTKKSSSSSSSHVKIIVHKTVVEDVHLYEKVHHTVVGFSMMSQGLPQSQQRNCRWGDAAWSAWKTIDGKTV
ncbi:MAG TPA: hypothetical protein VLF88_01445 [Candidatus Babeliales bacterium]|nr:hypothetical protein [Candidatus Babeliales bacterium]